ncbi:hypothetical protein HOD20_03850 [archaeon]|jgi:hypothetical protein|nr:hypothetical protein [archaeon]MBT4351636.1 hypothetical protein [archaeon]MBT4647383.1 hypothetical protein [archaeon]MBT6821386.1 hypothetical protein [archaeon]MBT7392839.1 hypothetical protein [archaeon]
MDAEKKNEKRRSELKKQILTLEWDKKQRQINFSKQKMLEDYKKELDLINNGEEIKKDN